MGEEASQTAEEAKIMFTRRKQDIHRAAISMVQRSAVKAYYHDGCLAIGEYSGGLEVNIGPLTEKQKPSSVFCTY